MLWRSPLAAASTALANVSKSCRMSSGASVLPLVEKSFVHDTSRRVLDCGALVGGSGDRVVEGGVDLILGVAVRVVRVRRQVGEGLGVFLGRVVALKLASTS